MSQSHLTVSCVVAAASAASAQSGFIITVDYRDGLTALTPANPACTIRITAAFPRTDHAFAAAWWNVNAGEPEWSSHFLPKPVHSLGTNPGTITGASVDDIIAGQIFVVGQPGGLLYPDNPIDAWEATYTATNFTPRQVAVSTETFAFMVYPFPNRGRNESRMAGLTEGRALIAITPAPAPLVLLVGAGAWRARRRRVRDRVGL